MTDQLSPRQMVLSGLVKDGTLRMHWDTDIFCQTLPSHVRQASLDRVRGMMLGLAIGDALGNTSEGMRPGHRRSLYGEIENYLPNHYAGGRAGRIAVRRHPARTASISQSCKDRILSTTVNEQN